MTSYTSYAEVFANSGTPLSQADVDIIIGRADRRVNVKLSSLGLSANYTAEALKGAGLAYALAGVASRMRMDGTKPNSLSLPTGLSMGDNVDNIIAGYEAEAAEFLAEYARTVKKISPDMMGGSVRADDNMTAFKTNQRPLPRYGGDRSY